MYECAHSFITFNNLNIPSYDVHSVQARDQMLVNLYKLQQSFVKINNIITEKTKQQNERVQKIRQRINNCVKRIQEIQGVNKAICFVSPGQYPTKYKFDPERNVSIFKELIERTKVNKFDLEAHYQMKHDLQKIGMPSKLQLDNLYKFVLFLYGKLKCKKMSTLQSSIAHRKVQAKNLGRIPNTIRYVDSLTIFDTYINPYNNYQLAPVKISKVKQKQSQQQQIKQIVSINTYMKPSYQLEDTNYKPATQQIDEIELDDDLALDGVVDIDLDDFLSGMSTGIGVIEKKVVEDPFKQKGISSSQITNTSNSSLLPPPSMPSYNSNSSMLPPPPPPPSFSSSSSSLPPPPSLGSLPPPPSLSSLSLTPGSLPPPPSLSSLGLPPPPSLGSLGIPPPPSLGLPSPPSLSLGQPPQLSAPPQMPAPSGSGNRADLLKQLNNPNPMSRLKKTVTRQTPNILTGVRAGPPPSTDSGQAPRPLSHMEALQMKIRNRFKALHPDRQEEQEQD